MYIYNYIYIYIYIYIEREREREREKDRYNSELVAFISLYLRNSYTVGHCSSWCDNLDLIYVGLPTRSGSPTRSNFENTNIENRVSFSTIRSDLDEGVTKSAHFRIPSTARSNVPITLLNCAPDIDRYNSEIVAFISLYLRNSYTVGQCSSWCYNLDLVLCT